VVVFGAYVRLNAAGLGCPDWPGCYGHATPVGAEHGIAAGTTDPGHTPLDVGKAWLEMLHRYLAGTLVLLIVAIVALAFSQRRLRGSASLPSVIALLFIVLLQALLGMLTVTWLVAPQIVTLHLLFGLTTLGLLWWLWLTLRAAAPRGTTTALGRVGQTSLAGAWSHPDNLPRQLALVGLIALVLQIALGGWTSTNYAAIACPDFPTCQASWWPQMDFGNAFVLWRPPTVNYEGGVLTSAARVAIHFTHRLGALIASLALVLSAVWVLRNRSRVLRDAHPAAIAVLAALALQLLIGISMVMSGFPLWLATAHNAGAALTLLAVLLLNHRLRVAR
jgi:heme a synthase